MEEGLIAVVAQAEAQAAKIREEAQTEAAQIIAAAEKRAAEIIKTAEVSCAKYRKEALAAACAEADNEYNAAIAGSAAAAKEYADGLIARSEGYVLDVVGRLAK